MAKEVNKFILEGEEIKFTDSNARQDISTLEAKVDNNFDLLDNKIDTEAGILDNKIDTTNLQLTNKINTQGVPAGGSTSQILAKTSNNDYATQWVNAPTPGPGGSDIDDSVIALDKTWSSSKINSDLADITSTETTTSTTITIGNTSSQCTIKKRGRNCAIGIQIESYTASSANITIGVIPEGYRPRQDIERVVLAKTLGQWATATYYPFIIRVDRFGDVYLRGNTNDLTSTHFLEAIIDWEV